jgi:hypothetical protein
MERLSIKKSSKVMLQAIVFRGVTHLYLQNIAESRTNRTRMQRNDV